MATGDQNDMLSRLKATLPVGWFPDSTPILDAVLTGWANMWAFLYSLFSYSALQTRLRSATDAWLDMIAGDFFGLGLQRRQGQTDASYRAQILANIFRERATRLGIIKVMQDLTGRTPIVIEPRRPVDNGAYSQPVAFWGKAGRFGSLLTGPYECFVKAYRPLVGSSQYGVTDADIYAAIDSVRMNNVTVWVQILD